MSDKQNTVVIVGYSRTPIGNFQGGLSSQTAPDLGACAIRAACSRAQLTDLSLVDQVLMGCVLAAGLGQAPARQAAIKAGLPESVGCITLNKMCGSGMSAIMLGCDMIKAGSADIVVAGGMESMSNAPYLIPKARCGLNLGHADLVDHLLCDGLEDPWLGHHMGRYAEDCAHEYGFTREQQDEYATQSLLRARKAIKNGWFQSQIQPVPVARGEQTYDFVTDEHPLSVDAAKIPRLKPIFRTGGTVTAANSSSISDGAAAIVLMSSDRAQRLKIQPLARILAHQTHAQLPEKFTTAPISAVDKLLHRLDLPISAVDLFEINEAFAVVALAAMRSLELSHEQINIHGGACALGHPIGASGVRIVVTLLAELQQYDLHRGIASLCIGGGEATAIAVQR